MLEAISRRLEFPRLFRWFFQRCFGKVRATTARRQRIWDMPGFDSFLQQWMYCGGFTQNSSRVNCQCHQLYFVDSISSRFVRLSALHWNSILFRFRSAGDIGKGKINLESRRQGIFMDVLCLDNSEYYLSSFRLAKRNIWRLV